MTTQFHWDEARSKHTEAVYSTPDIVGQRRAFLQMLRLVAGERVADIGSGPGFLAAEMAAIVGPSGRVAGVDRSESMIAIARTRCAAHPHAEFRLGDATQLPLPDGAFDAAVSTQVFEYLDDRGLTRALAEVFRILRPGGRALILDTDGDSIVWHSTDRARMARILRAWEDHCADFHLPPKLSARLTAAGLRVRRRDIIPVFNPEYDPNTYSNGLISLITAFVPGRNGLTEDDLRAWEEDLQALGRVGQYFFSLNRYLFEAAKPESPTGPAPDATK